ncbi:hypothetical protein HPP92_005417 [Vanilla planifolia]|uniref:Pectinesterase inhibitor domain-containing protein n=1 Tax=Vanilla planifolia TaxID=51239 RepID=A0A835VEN1_VANPL|nr:hypothetical protein HPP92_005417 [Vanilla planifolia]
MHSLICDGEYRSLDKHERERRRRLVIWSSCLIMAVFLLAISLAVLNNPKPKTDIHIVSKGANFIKTTAASAAASNGMVTAACKSTLYPAACESALGGPAAKSLNDIFSASVESAKLRASSARALAYNLTVPKSKSKAKTASFGRPTVLTTVSSSSTSAWSSWMTSSTAKGRANKAPTTSIRGSARR